MSATAANRAPSALLVTLVLLGSLVLAAQNGNEPQSDGGPTVEILTPYEILEPSPSSKPNDKDGFPPQSSEADVEEMNLQVMIVVDSAITDPTLTIEDDDFDGVDDEYVDNDSPRDLSALDGTDDGTLDPGVYYVYFSLNKTGYVPVPTPQGAEYNESNSASVGTVGGIDKFRAMLTWSGGSAVSDWFSVENVKSASINQSDLEWLQTSPEVLDVEVGDTFQVRSKYQQSSAQGLKELMMHAYYVGEVFRLDAMCLYYYDDTDPGDISQDLPDPTQLFCDDQYLDEADLPDTDNSDYFVSQYNFTVIGGGSSPIRPYIQTRKSGSNWKTDTGYAEFQGIEPPSMAIIKAANVAQADPGDTVQYMITLWNNGSGPATNVVVEDTIDAGTTFVDSNPAYSGNSGDTYWFNFSSIAGNSVEYIFINVTVDIGVADGTVLTNCATLDYEDFAGSPQPQEGPACADVTVTAPIMEIAKAANVAEADPGDTIQYTVTLWNNGSGEATDVVVEDSIDPDTTFASANPTPSGQSGDTLWFNFSSIAGNSVTNILIDVTVDVGVADGTVLTNCAELAYDDSNGNPQPGEGPVCVDVTVTAPLLSITKTADVSTADPGDQITYTIDYQNTGSGEATDVVIEDTIDPETTFVDATPYPDSSSGDVLTWNIGSVAGNSGGSITLIVEVDVGTADGTILTNVVVITGEDANDNPIPGDEDEADVTVTAPIMTITKTADVSTADPGDQITYTIEYENSGTGEATDVVIVDAIDPDTTFVDAVPYPDSVSGDVLTWNIGGVAGNSGGTIILIVDVDTYVADQTVLTNGVTLNYDDANGNPYPEESDSVDVTVTAPVMTITKTADVSTADPGDTIVYTLSYENTGTGEATDVVVVDTLPDEVTYDSASPSPDNINGQVLTWNIGSVAGGGSGSITVTVTVNVGTADGTVLTNGVTLNYDDANGNPYPEESDFADVTVTAPVMTFSKTADVTTADPGDQITYTLSYENTGSGDATNVVVEDTIPAETTYVSSNPAYDTQSGDTYTWNIGTVAAGASGSITLVVEVDAGTADGTLLHNEATLDYSDANGNYIEQLSDFADVTVTAPVMTITKTADVTTADPSDQITYTLSYENTGTGEATDVVIEDTIPADTTFVSSNPAYDSQSGDTYTWNIGSVAGGGSGTITFVVEVDVGTPDGTVLTNSVTLDYDDANGNPYPQESDSVDVTVTAPIMTITKTADVSTADPGDTIVYTLSYENTGSGEATGVTIVDTIPADVTYQSASPAPDNINGQVLTWNIGSVAGGGSGSITITVTVDVGTADGTLLHNVADLDYNDANGNPYPTESDFADVTVTAPIMTFSKSADVSTADPSDTIVYTLEYENTGSGDASNVVIEDTIPAETTFVSSNPAYDSVSGDTYTWNIGDVAAGASGTITVTVTVDAYTADGTLLVNTATLDYSDANGNYIEQLSDSAETTVTAPVMTVTKTADVSLADPGDLITYTIEYENTGSGEATDVVIEDTIPADTTYVSSNPAYDSVSGDTYTWNIGSVAGGGSGTITLVVMVDAGTPDGTLLVNEVTLNYDDANGNPYPEESDTAETTVTAPVGDLTKEADVSTADPGDTVVYTVTFTNTGSGDATDVYVNDTIPADTTFVSSNPAYDSQSGDTYTWHFALVAAGDSVTVTVTVTVDAYTADQTLLHNVATVEYFDANSNYVEQLTAFADVTVTAPVLSVTKTADVSTADPGDTIVYTIVVENTGTGEATDLVIEDTIPADTTFDSASPAPDSVSGDVVTWTLSSLLGGDSATFTLTVTVDAYVPDQTILHNVVTVDYDDSNGNPYPQISDYADVTVTAPVMTFTKTADVSTADPGDTIVYTLEYENTGTGDAGNVVIVDTLPDDVTYVSANPTPDSISGQVLTWNIGTVVAGGSGTITITVTVNAYTADQTVLHNVATLDYEDVNGNAYPQLSDYADVTVTAPVMTFSKTADVSTADPGDTIVYTLEYENTGSGDATGVTIVDTLPDDVTFVGATPAPDSISGQVLTWNIGTVAGGSGGTVAVTVTVNPGTADQTLLHNVATLDYDDANGNPYPQLSDYADVIVTAPVMTFSKTADVTTADPGDQITYTLSYENTGTGDASSVVVVDTLPADVTYISATPPPSIISGQVLIWIVGFVAAGTSGTITVTVEVIPGTPDQTVLHNEAILDYSDANGNFVEQLSDFADVVVTAPVMTLSKEVAGEISIRAYVIADFTLRVAGEKWHDVVLTIYDGGVAVAVASVTRYPGSPDDQAVTIHNVSINLLSDDFQAVIEYTPWDDPINGQWLGANPAWLILTLQDGSTVRLHHNFVVKQPKTWVWIVDEFQPYLVGQPITFEATVPYMITYENIGTGDATNVVVSDTIPAGTILEDSNPAYDSVSGDTYTWNIGDVAAGEMGHIFLNVTYIITNLTSDDLPDEIVLTNSVTLDYSDANGNFVEQLSDSVTVIIETPDLGFMFPSPTSWSDPETGIQPLMAPHAVISSPASFSILEVGEFVFFDGSESWDEETPIDHYWDFGDGATSTATSPVHIFTDAGFFKVRLVVTDQDGMNDEAMVYVFVEHPEDSIIPGTPLSSGSEATGQSSSLPEGMTPPAPDIEGPQSTANGVPAGGQSSQPQTQGQLEGESAPQTPGSSTAVPNALPPPTATVSVDSGEPAANSEGTPTPLAYMAMLILEGLVLLGAGRMYLGRGKASR